MAKPRFRLVFLVAAFSLAQAICWGMTFNLPAVAGKAMGQALGLPYVAIMAGPTVMLLVMALSAIPMLRIFEILGARYVMTAGVLIGALGLATVGLAATPWIYFGGWLIVGVAGAGMLTTAMQIGVTELAGSRARAAIGPLLIFGGLSTSISWPLVSALQSAFGWRVATLLWAVLLFAVAGPIYWILLSHRRHRHAYKINDEPIPALDWTAFTLLSVCTGLNGIVTWRFSPTIITLFEARGLEHGTAVVVGSLVGVATLPAWLINFIASRHLNGLVIALLAGAGFPLSFVLLNFGTGPAAALAFVAFYGLTSGVLTVARSTMPLDLFPIRAYTLASSALALPLNVSFAGAPLLFAGILSGPGSDVALWIATGLSLVALCAMSTLVIRHGTAAVRPEKR